MRKPDFEIDLTQEQLTKAVGDYCADTLRRIPVGTYDQTQLSITTNGITGEVKAVFRAWAPPGVLGGPIPMHIANRSLRAGELVTDKDVRPIPTITAQGYDPEANEPEPEAKA